MGEVWSSPNGSVRDIVSFGTLEIPQWMFEWQQFDGAGRTETIKSMTSTDFGEFQRDGDARATLKEREREEGNANKAKRSTDRHPHDCRP